MAVEFKGSVTRDGNPVRAWLVGVAGWLVPGAGHAWQGHWWRALLLGGAVWAMFIGGLLLGGHLFSPGGGEGGWSGLLQLPPAVANLGAGLLYIVCWASGIGLTEQASRTTFEYGNTFLLVSGLLNYLVALDAFDTAVGRKP